MERDGKRFISVKSTRDAFLELQLSISSDNLTWCEALEIFEDRIYGRFFNPIDCLINRDVNQNGFAIMALDCLLVETLYQFHNGADETGDGNANRYADFLEIIMPGIFPDFKSRKRFYSDIRCGILHSAQTKRGSRLTFGQENIVDVFEDGKIRVDVVKFTKKLQEYYRVYIDSLRCECNTPLRQAFINKMNFICRLNEE